MRVKANALYYALFILLLSGVVISALLIYTYWSKVETNRFLIELKLNRAIESGIQIITKKREEIFYQDIFPIDKNQSIEIKKHPWNLYSIGKVNAKLHAHTKKNAHLLALQPLQKDSIALFLPVKTTQLQLASNIYIHGNLMLGERGFKKANLGNEKQTNQTIKGNHIPHNQNNLPKLTEDIQFIQNSSIESWIENMDIENLNISEIKKQTLHQSFTEKTILLSVPEDSQLQNINLKGNIILYCPGQLRIRKSAQLESIWVIASSIQIDDGWVSPSIHLYAENNIKVGKYSQMHFPSSIFVNQKAHFQTLTTVLELKENSLIEGNVVVLSHTNQTKFILSKIAEQATIHGESYIMGKLNHYGISYGTIYAEELYYKTDSGILKNYLIDAQIDVKTRNPYFCSVIEQNKLKKQLSIIQWLN